MCKFYQIIGFPNVIGCIDGTLIQIRKFSKERINAYISRRHKPEVNIMAVCGPDNLILYAVCKWPGSVSDQRVFRESALREKLECGMN